MRVSAHFCSQWSRYVSASSDVFEALSFQRRLLRMPDAGLDFAFPVGIGNPARQRDSAVMSEHVAVQRIKRRVVDISFEDAFAQVVEHDYAQASAESAERLFMQWRPGLRVDSKTSSRTDFRL